MPGAGRPGFRNAISLDQFAADHIGTQTRFLSLALSSEDSGGLSWTRTGAFPGRNLGVGSSHSTRNLPVLLGGDGFQHGQHLPFEASNPPPLCNLCVNMLQRLGSETDKFGTSTGTLTGLEFSRG